jgi:hypothetical protein
MARKTTAPTPTAKPWHEMTTEELIEARQRLMGMLNQPLHERMVQAIAGEIQTITHLLPTA